MALIRALAVQYGVTVVLTRDSPDNLVTTAYRKVAARAHPDKGGSTEDVQRLNAARDAWQQAKKGGQGSGASSSGQMAAATSQKASFRIQSSAVLLTFSGIKSLDHWREFLAFVRSSLQNWQVWRWSATLESSKAGNWHIHIMLQFRVQIDRDSKSFAFQGIAPNAGPNGIGRDLCNEGLCRKKLQMSIDRGMFYVYANKIGTLLDETGAQGCSKPGF